jgi:S1-C subfamily serine protease
MTPRVARSLLFVIALIACAGAGFWAHALWTGMTARPTPTAPSPMSTADALQEAIVAVAGQVRPAVVHVGTVQVARSRRPQAGAGPFANDPSYKDFFDQFFGPRGPEAPGEFRTPGLGSGVIIDKRGYVITNFHVVKGADAVIIRLSSKEEFRGRVVGSDLKTDLAVVRFEPERTELRVAQLGNSDALRVGEWAIAIGNPFGLDQTVTVGVVSAVGRADVGIATYENFIQTDASINPGNSGGPLVNLRGEVIGINTAIVATGQGIGFAIPASMVKRVTAQLVDRGKVTRGWTGAETQALTRGVPGPDGYARRHRLAHPARQPGGGGRPSEAGCHRRLRRRAHRRLSALPASVGRRRGRQEGSSRDHSRPAEAFRRVDHRRGP